MNLQRPTLRAFGRPLPAAPSRHCFATALLGLAGRSRGNSNLVGVRTPPQRGFAAQPEARCVGALILSVRQHSSPVWRFLRRQRQRRSAAGSPLAPGGALYWFQEDSGTNNTWGAVFKVNQDGTGFGVLHDLPSDSGDGMEPWPTSLVVSTNALHGTTRSGGSAGCGTLFKLDPESTGYQVVTSFLGNVAINDGTSPRGIVEGSDGTLYGVTVRGGTHDYGAAFHINKDGTRYGIEDATFGRRSDSPRYQSSEAPNRPIPKALKGR